MYISHPMHISKHPYSQIMDYSASFLGAPITPDNLVKTKACETSSPIHVTDIPALLNCFG
jgi:hypothetical protein